MTTLALPKIQVNDALVVFFASLLIALFGSVSIPLWFTPIPIATQNMVIFMLAATLGGRRAFAAVSLFLMQGAMGLPVFANGAAGLGILMGPRGGYLIGYAAATFLVGYLIEKKWHPLAAFGAGALTIFAFGAAYLSSFVGLEKAFTLGVAPFLFGDFLKVLFCWQLYKRI